MIRGSLAILTALLALTFAPPVAEASDADHQVKKLTKKVKRLSKKVKTLEARLEGLSAGPTGATGPAGPATGPAGGALAGTYPDPVLAVGAVTSAAVAEGAVTGAGVLDDSLTAADLQGGAATGAISLNAGFVADGRCRDFNLAVSGARVGDAVIFSINGAIPQTVALSGVRVSAPDVVVAKACNLSGAAFPQLNDVPVAVVTVSP
jgi:hypothetical protein